MKLPQAGRPFPVTGVTSCTSDNRGSALTAHRLTAGGGWAVTVTAGFWPCECTLKCVDLESLS